MSWRTRTDLPAATGGVLVLLVTAGLPAGWRAGLALTVVALLVAGARGRLPAATTGGLLLLVAVAAGVDTASGSVPGGAAAIALAVGVVVVTGTAAGRDAPPPRVDARARLVEVLPVAGVVLVTVPVALLVAGAAATAPPWALLGSGVLVAGLLVAATRAGTGPDAS